MTEVTKSLFSGETSTHDVCNPADSIGRIRKVLDATFTRTVFGPSEERAQLAAEALRGLDRLAAWATEITEALARVVANEGNHYDRFWTPVPEPLTDAWLDETEVKMREALTDVFCDDAASVMLTLIAEIRRLARIAMQNDEVSS